MRLPMLLLLLLFFSEHCFPADHPQVPANMSESDFSEFDSNDSPPGTPTARLANPTEKEISAAALILDAALCSQFNIYEQIENYAGKCFYCCATSKQFKSSCPFSDMQKNQRNTVELIELGKALINHAQASGEDQPKARSAVEEARHHCSKPLDKPPLHKGLRKRS